MQDNQRIVIKNGRVMLVTHRPSHVEIISRIDGETGVTRIDAIVEQEDYVFVWTAQKMNESTRKSTITMGAGKSASDAYNQALEYVASCHSLEV